MSTRNTLIDNVTRRLNNMLLDNDSEGLRSAIYQNKLSNYRNSSNLSANSFQNILRSILGSNPNNNNLKPLVRDILFPPKIQTIIKREYIPTTTIHTTVKSNGITTKPVKTSERVVGVHERRSVSQREPVKEVKRIIRTTVVEEKKEDKENVVVGDESEDKYIKDIFETYDVKNTNTIHSGDVYFAIIEIA